MKDSVDEGKWKAMTIHIKTIDGTQHEYANVETYDLHNEYMMLVLRKDNDDSPDHQVVFPLRSIMNAEIWEP